jgi:putative ABC transport system substrate-binding protein
MKRRDFIGAAAGMALGWPHAAWAQPHDNRVRRLALFMNLPEGDADGARWIAALYRSLYEFGWIEGQNIQVDIRWVGNGERIHEKAAELVALGPDVIVAAGPAVLAIRQVTRTVPIVFVAIVDPVALGVVESLAHPGGNATGFSPGEVSLGAKWLQVLKEMAPALARVGVFHDSANAGSALQLAAVQAAASALAVAVSVIDVRDKAAVEPAVAAFASSPNSGLITLRVAETTAMRGVLIGLAAQYRLPAIYPLRVFATAGGLASYGPDLMEEYRDAGGYVDRILRGEKPANLPVQVASKFQLALNLKTAKALGLSMPQTLLSTADEVFE